MTAVESLQRCLAAEHAALYGYGVIAAVLEVSVPGSRDQGYAESCYYVHRRRRDRLVEVIAAADAEPVAAEPAYPLPYDVEGPALCRRLARLLEQRVAAVYAAAVASTVADQRRLALDALVDAAVRGSAWGAAPDAFPGIDELA